MSACTHALFNFSDEAWISTKNHMGWMVNKEIDEYTKQFIDFASTADGPVADIGCAYGFHARELLKCGAKKVIANDLDKGHLDMLWKSVEENTDFCGRLVLMPGNALELHFEPDSLSGILAANLLHFLSPAEVRKAFDLFYCALKPNGILCVVTGSLHNGLYQKVWDIVERRIAEGNEWPGYWNAEELCGSENNFPAMVLFMDPDILEREAKLAGFCIEKVGYFARQFIPENARMDGRENAGLLAVKFSGKADVAANEKVLLDTEPGPIEYTI